MATARTAGFRRPYGGDAMMGQPTGTFLSLDGPDGGGKSTQAARLVDWLKGRGFDVIACRDPGGTPLGERVRSVLLDRSATEPVLRAEMLLFMASRAQLVDQVIRPALEAGKVVVSDRYLLANVVYQGYAGGLPIEMLWEVGRAATGGLLPDLTLLLDVPPEVARARVGKARDRMEDRADASLIRAGFLQAVPTYPAPIKVIEASGDPDTVARVIQDEVAHALAIDPRP
jgi:dTMP kinase